MRRNKEEMYNFDSFTHILTFNLSKPVVFEVRDCKLPLFFLLSKMARFAAEPTITEISIDEGEVRTFKSDE